MKLSGGEKWEDEKKEGNGEDGVEREMIGSEGGDKWTVDFEVDVCER